LPSGYCFAVDCRLPFAVQAIIQDMRSVASAPDISIFIEVSFGLAPQEAAIEPATLVWNEAPHGPYGYSRFAVLDTPTMSWWTMQWPVSGVLLPSAKLHSHYARHHRLFLIDAAPQNLAFFASHVKGIVHVHESIPPTSPHETMLLTNLSRTEQTLSQLPNVICQDDGTMPSFIVAASRGHPNASRWARRREFVCSPYALDKGRVSTFVQLYRAIAEPDVRFYPMHTNTWFYMRIAGAASSSDIKTVSYRYATCRTEALLEPLQDEAVGSCEGKLALNAVDSYVSNNAAGLSQAVKAQHAGAAAVARVPAASLAGDAGNRRTSIVAVYASCAAFLAFVGLRVREARAHTLL